MSADVVSQFNQFALAAPVLKAVEEIGYETPSPIQAATIPPLLEGRDLVGQAQTGTGKTAAFALPLLSRIDLNQPKVQALVLTPTRELALQVAEAMQGYARHLPGFHILPVYGGQGMGTQLRQLHRGVHVVVGTPGRVMDHLRRETLKLDGLTTLVLDEADEMLRMGFIDDVEWILGQTPPARQIALFSATMPPEIQRVARRHLRDPMEIKIAAKTATVETIRQRYWQVSGLHKPDALTRILEVEEFDAMIIFVRTKTETVVLSEKLEARGYACAALNGDINQIQREQTVDKLKRGQIDIVVATDVAARGLDVERISHVVNYDIPYDTEAYVHRIGRTGRAGRKGDAILFVAPRERRMLQAIERATRQRIEPMNIPTSEAVADKRIAKFKQLISETLESQDLEPFETLVEGFQSEHDVGLAEVAAALAYLVQRERPLWPAEEPVREREFQPPFQRNEGRGEGRFERKGPRRGEGGEGFPREFGERKPREDRPERPRRAPTPPDAGMERYRLDVGKEHGVLPKHIVGAIANEANMESRYIGRIDLHDTWSTVDLPEGMPKEVMQHLRKVWVCGRTLNISRLGEEPAATSHSEPAPRPPKKHARPAVKHGTTATHGREKPKGFAKKGGEHKKTRRPERKE